MYLLLVDLVAMHQMTGPGKRARRANLTPRGSHTAAARERRRLAVVQPRASNATTTQQYRCNTERTAEKKSLMLMRTAANYKQTGDNAKCTNPQLTRAGDAFWNLTMDRGMVSYTRQHRGSAESGAYSSARSLFDFNTVWSSMRYATKTSLTMCTLLHKMFTLATPPQSHRLEHHPRLVTTAL